MYWSVTRKVDFFVGYKFLKSVAKFSVFTHLGDPGISGSSIKLLCFVKICRVIK